MLDTLAETPPDRRPAVLICVYEEADPAWPLPGETGSAPWLQAKLTTVGPADPGALANDINEALASPSCRAVLLVGRTRKSDAFRIQMRAENKALGGNGKLSRTGPALARATAPAAEIVRALDEAGLAAEATSDSEEDAGTYLLYRILTAQPDDADAKAVGLLRAPQATSAPDVQRGIQVAAAAMARHLSPLPRQVSS